MSELFWPFDDATATPQEEPKPLLAGLAPLRVAFQGEAGAFGEEAIAQLWRGEAQPVPMRSFDDVMQAAETGQVDYGMLPIESTLIGGVDVAYDLLALHEGLFVVAETVVRVNLNLLALPDTRIEHIKELLSHPIMLAQCSYFLHRHRHITPRPTWDTAGAAREVVERNDPAVAAAAGPLAATRFELEVLAPHIEDRPDTMMRFLAVTSEPAGLAEGTPARTAMLCDLENRPGALFGIVRPPSRLGLNVSHFTSRPTREPWQYQFYIEFEHDAGDARAQQAIDEIRAASTFSRVLGTFPRTLTVSAGEGEGAIESQM